MQNSDTVHYIVAVKRKADEMDVKDKEMTIELEDVSEEESKEQTEECSDKKQRHKRKGGCFKTVMLAFAMVIVVGVSFFAGRQSVMTSSGFGTGLNNGTILRKLSLLEAYTGKYYLNKIDADNVEQNIYKGFAKGSQYPYAEYYTKEEFKQIADEKPGFIRAMWCGCQECEDAIKEDFGVTSRCIPFKQVKLSDTCVYCGKPATKMVYWGKAY